MTKCSFCSNELSPGTGKMLVKNDGRIIYFCSNKCEKNLIKLGRNSKNFKWTQKKKQNK